MNKNNFFIFLVIYNQSINNEFIEKQNKIKNNIYIIDNSTKENIKSVNKQICEKNNFTYIDMEGNKGLPKAYNTAIKRIEKKEDNWIFILDQDTEIDEKFIEKYETAIVNNPDKLIFSPLIKDSKGIMSPTKIKGKDFAHSKMCNYNNSINCYSFINSGMCINSKIFEKIEYDENLFLDFVDHDFVMEIKKLFSNNIFYVINDIDIYQNFSGVTKNTYQSDITRFKILVKDEYYFYNKHYNNISYARRKLFLRALKLSFIHKNFEFIKILENKK